MPGPTLSGVRAPAYATYPPKAMKERKRTTSTTRPAPAIFNFSANSDIDNRPLLKIVKVASTGLLAA
jgi:hypothetical protein